MVIAGEPPQLGYVATVGIAGSRFGTLLFTADKELILDIFRLKLDQEHPSPGNIAGLVGEIANNIAGNVTEVYGNELVISVPIVTDEEPEELYLTEPSYIFPIYWRTHEASVVIGINYPEKSYPDRLHI